MKKIDELLLSALVIIFIVSLSFAQIFPPTKPTGPFPTGNEPVRNDSPIDITRPSDMIHEYTCYNVETGPVIDGEIEEDSVWNLIPWTVMTFWENNGYTEEFSVFDDITNDNWSGFEDCTAWWKLLWDGDLVYIAIKVIDDDYNAPTAPANPGDMHQQDCIQFGLHTAPPEVDEMDESDLGCELGFGITDANGDFEELFANWNWSGHPWCNAQMQLTDGDNECGNASTDGKAFHASVEEAENYYIYRFEAALELFNDEWPWLDWIEDGYLGRVSVMAMDHDTQEYEDVNWGSGILGKDFTRLASMLWSADPPPTTAVESDYSMAPRAFELAQNFPNPFNPATTIQYRVPLRSRVTLTIFNISGEEVATLVNAEKAAGNYQVHFDAQHLSAGLYFYRLDVGKQQITKKMTYLR